MFSCLSLSLCLTITEDNITLYFIKGKVVFVKAQQHLTLGFYNKLCSLLYPTTLTVEEKVLSFQNIANPIYSPPTNT